jgi:uncharacterized membrane protein YdcZ (DUF606 family)
MLRRTIYYLSTRSIITKPKPSSPRSSKYEMIGGTLGAIAVGTTAAWKTREYPTTITVYVGMIGSVVGGIAGAFFPATGPAIAIAYALTYTRTDN